MNKLAVTSTLFLGCMTAANAQAQNAERPPAVANAMFANLETSTVLVRAVRPDILAYWLDPIGNKAPREFDKSGAVAAPGFEAQQGKPLVPGLEVAHAIRAKNSILLAGTKESISRATEILSALDKPLRQVEVECQMCVMDNARAEELIRQWRAKDSKGLVPGQILEVLPAPQNFQKFLGEEFKGDSMRIVTAPRITAIDRLTAELKADTNTPFLLDLKEVKYEGRAPLAYFTQSIGLRVTPTFTGKDTVSLQLLPLITESLSAVLTQTDTLPRPATAAQTHLPLSSRYKEIVLPMQDGETLALVDTTPYKASNSYLQNIEGKRICWFVTSRVVRRLGDA